jgi:hypothetical protein
VRSPIVGRSGGAVAYPLLVTGDQAWPLPGDPNASIGARHHRLPRFYLERFADERRQITTIDRRTGERWTGAITDAAAEKDFYTSINLDGAKDGRAEQLLTQIEGAAAAAIGHIVNPVFSLFPPQPQDRGALCMFLAFQRVRGRSARKKIELLGDLYAHLRIPSGMTVDEAAGWLRASELEVTTEAVRDLVELSADMDNLEFVPDPNAHLGVMGGAALRIFDEVIPRPWYLVEYDSPALLTSDEPVALHFRDHNRPPGHGNGIANTDEIWFPLDPCRLLALGKPGDPLPEQRVKVARETAKIVNVTVAAGAYEYIYMHPGQDHLRGIRLPRPAPLLQVNGQLPIDLSRYNNPPATTRTQRRK